MTVNEMLTRLGYSLDDPDGNRYTSPIKLAALNTAQDDIAGIAHTSLLSSLQTTQSFTALANGNNLSTNYFRYVNSKLRLRSPVKWIVKLDMDKVGMIDDNQFSRGSDLDPVCYIWGNVYYLMITAASYGGDNSAVTLYYVKKPTALTAGGTCELHVSLHKHILKSAESDLKLTYKHGSVEAALKMKDDAEGAVYRLNQRYESGELL